jgi:hypothetical protein
MDGSSALHNPAVGRLLRTVLHPGNPQPYGEITMMRARSLLRLAK